MKNLPPSCRETYREICAGIGEELNSERCRAIRKHIRGCANCTAYLAGLKKTIGLYRAYPTPKHTPLRYTLRRTRRG